MATDTRRCTDCEGCMTEVKLLDKGHSNIQHPLEYSALDAKRSFWAFNLPVIGTVKAFRCDNCGLLKMYGVPTA